LASATAPSVQQGLVPRKIAVDEPFDHTTRTLER
jgi:hypothetical protein